MLKYKVSSTKQVKEILQELFPDSSRRTRQKWLKRFCIDGKPFILQENMVLTEGQILSTQEASFQVKKLQDVKIIYEDRYFIAIEKPPGLLSVPLDDPNAKRHALGMLRHFYRTDQIFAVHRIDRETSGVLLFARGHDAKEKFKELFKKHDLLREYLTIVEGKMNADKGTWSSYLQELPNFDVTVTTAPEEGKLSITHFEVLWRSQKYSYLRCLLETGRKHQIRIHCREAGFPVLGDKRYGATENPVHRLCLHARRISFKHPFTGKNHTFISPLPRSFKKLGLTEPRLAIISPKAKTE